MDKNALFAEYVDDVKSWGVLSEGRIEEIYDGFFSPSKSMRDSAKGSTSKANTKVLSTSIGSMLTHEENENNLI